MLVQINDSIGLLSDKVEKVSSLFFSDEVYFFTIILGVQMFVGFEGPLPINLQEKVPLNL